MLNVSRVAAVLAVLVIVTTGTVGWTGPASAIPSVAPGDEGEGPPPEVTPTRGRNKVFVTGTQNGKAATQGTTPAYTGPTRLQLAYQRCEEGDFVLGGVPCRSGAFAAEVLRRMMADRPGAPGSAAREVVAALGLAPPRIGMTPRPGPDSVALVGYDVWLWVDSPDAQTFGPATATASIDAWTLTVTGRVEWVDWDTGDGNVVRCTGPGTPYEVYRDGLGPSPDCGHVYAQQGQYTVTATAHWRVDWTTSDGTQSGTFTTDLVSTVPVTVGEWQVLVKRG